MSAYSLYVISKHVNHYKVACYCLLQKIYRQPLKKITHHTTRLAQDQGLELQSKGQGRGFQGNGQGQKIWP